MHKDFLTTDLLDEITNVPDPRVRNILYIQRGYKYGWNASRKHRDLQIVEALGSLLGTAPSDSRERALLRFYEQLREGTK